MPKAHVLTLSRVAKTYRAGVPGCAASTQVLRGASLKLRPDELAAVEGSTGAGKTTLLLCAAGMLRPDEGEVRWPALTPREGRSPAGIAYVADRPTTYAFLTVRESLSYAATVRETHAPGSSCAPSDVLDAAALGEHAETRVGVLANAERSRLLVALALVSSPRLLLVDDLTGGPHPEGRRALADCLSRIAASGVGVIWAARSLPNCRDATAYALDRGRLQPGKHGRASAAQAPRDIVVLCRDDAPVPSVAPRLREGTS